ncbi:MAG: Peptidase S1 and S6, chymotrypsin/Hap [candidate division CPR1 bacterium GW2011_GWC1_49_13]|uniref:Peptidase S1 and S6, chymotrypsin/Hap n=1 Tax=candidate division CPR1 bacterium GW2011_GWC1_49_13 TaxID=1618342 RepID=A0A0G1XUI6_9BACT|nr:MAG: Peptidase S1 and S6, chymotrypsin/Hap [candidate division CPR1 bacterium GW2011_GWC1_49_13]
MAIGDPSKNGVRTFFSHLRLNLSLLRKLGGKKLAVFSFLGGFALALIIFGTAGLISWDKFSQIAFSDVDPQIAEELSRKIVYTGENFGKKEYYSPNLNLVFEYNPQKYTLYEGTKGIGITPSSRILNLLTTVEKAGASSDPIGDHIKYLQSGFAGLKVIEESQRNGVKYAKYSYPEKDYLNPGKTKDSFGLAALYEGQGFRLLLNIYYPKNLGIEEFLDDVIKILSSAKSASKIDSQIKAKLEGAGIEISFDRQKWQTIYQTSNSLNLDFRAAEYEPEGAAATSSFSIRLGYETGPNFSEPTLKQAIDNSLSISKGVHEKNRYKELSKYDQRTIGGKEFLSATFSYQWDFIDKPRIKKIYVGYPGTAQSGNDVIWIEADLSSADNAASKEVERVLDSLVFITAGTAEAGGVLGTATLEVEKAAILGSSAVAHIYNRSCVNVTIAKSTGLTKTAGNPYQICVGALGTGFYMSGDGIVVTNGHVATPDPTDAMMGSILEMAEPPQFWQDLLSDLEEVLEQEDPETLFQLYFASDEEVRGILFGFYMGLLGEGAVSEKVTSENFIQKDAPFTVSDYKTFKLTNPSLYWATETIVGQVDSRAEMFYKFFTEGINPQIKTPDLAILKVKGAETKVFPTLKLANFALLSVGQEVNAVGFPGAAEDQSLFSAGASAIPTVTKGTVSAKKPSINEQFEFLQIDASIAPGNSGGPILIQNGEVAAVSTYGINSGGTADFNVGVSAAEVGKLLGKNGIQVSQSESSQLIEMGLENLGRSYYRLAKENFYQALELYSPIAGILDPLIKLSDQKIAAGEDKTPPAIVRFLTATRGGQVLLILSGISLLAGLIFLIRHHARAVAGQAAAYATLATVPPAVPPAPAAYPEQYSQYQKPAPPLPTTPQAPTETVAPYQPQPTLPPLPEPQVPAEPTSPTYPQASPNLPEGETPTPTPLPPLPPTQAPEPQIQPPAQTSGEQPSATPPANDQRL